MKKNRKIFSVLVFLSFISIQGWAANAEQSPAEAKKEFLRLYKLGEKNKKVREYHPGGGDTALEFENISCHVSVAGWKDEKELKGFAASRFSCKTEEKSVNKKSEDQTKANSSANKNIVTPALRKTVVK